MFLRSQYFEHQEIGKAAPGLGIRFKCMALGSLASAVSGSWGALWIAIVLNFTILKNTERFGNTLFEHLAGSCGYPYILLEKCCTMVGSRARGVLTGLLFDDCGI